MENDNNGSSTHITTDISSQLKLERLLKECLKQFEQVKDPKLEKNYQSLIKGVEKDLLALRNNTEEVLKNTELMRESLDSLT